MRHKLANDTEKIRNLHVEFHLSMRHAIQILEIAIVLE
jgi:hypothetical protein